MEMIILAGGLGTRLKSMVPDLPKCMAPVAGKPFIDHLISYFLDGGVHKFVFALCHMHQLVLDHINTAWPNLDYDYSLETEPLGTGGAIQLASSKTVDDNFLVVNGDTIFPIDFKILFAVHLEKKAMVTIALKELSNFDRYGTLEIDSDQRIIRFNEKEKCTTGLINGGIYFINKEKFVNLRMPEKFSFEKEVLENQENLGQLYATVFDEYFIDIGIPEDFEKANHDLA